MNGLPPGSETVIAVVFLLIMFAVFLIDMGLLIAYTFNRPRALAGTERPIYAPVWSVVDVWLGGQAAILGVIIAVIPIVIVVAVIVGGFGSPEATQSAKFLVPVTCLSLIPQNFLLVMIPVLFITQKYKQSIASIGFKLKPEKSEIIVGLIAGVSVILLSLVLELILGSLALVIFGDHQLKVVADTGKKIGNEAIIESSMINPFWGFMMLIGGGILAPIGEEFFFRGFMFNALRHRLKLPVAVCISALLFALIHVSPLSVIIIFPMGIILALSYYYTGSLWVPIIIHMTNNGIQLLLLYGSNMIGHK